MASIEHMQIHLSVRWWVVPYLKTLAFLCRTMGTTPDFDSVTAFLIRHGIKVSRA